MACEDVKPLIMKTEDMNYAKRDQQKTNMTDRKQRQPLY